MAPLEGVRVIDLSRVLAGPFCTMLLGDMGADVIKIEEPSEGDDMRTWGPFIGAWSAYFLGLNRNKRSVALDLKSRDGQAALRALLADADVFVENIKPGSLDKLGFSVDVIGVLNPRLIHCTISGYGRTGPRRDLTGMDPVVQAESGFMDITGDPDGPPMRAGVAMTDYLAALYAYSGILLALRQRDRTGKGQHVDIALFDSILSTLAMPAGIAQATGQTPQRVGNAHPAIAPYEVLRAADGSLMVAAANSRLWKQLCTAVGVEHLFDDPRFTTNTDRVANRDVLAAGLERAFASFTVDALITRLQECGVPCGRVRTILEALEDPQIGPREMLIPLEDAEFKGFRVIGNPVKLSDDPPRLYRRPPGLGEHTTEVLDEINPTPQRKP